MSWLQLRDEFVDHSLPLALARVEVYPVTLEWGDVAMQLRDLGVSNRDIALALALAEDVDE